MMTIQRVAASRRFAVAFLLVLVSFLAAPVHSTRADGAITITTPSAVQNRFPDELVFTISAEDSAPITDVVLRYSFLPDGTTVLARAEFDKGNKIQATYHMRSNANSLYLPPGREVRYTWELTDANGAKLTTDAAQTAFMDTRFQWQSVNSGNLTLFFYRGATSDATNLLRVGRTAIDKAEQLEGTHIEFAVKLYAYASSQDFLPAAQKESKATDPGILGQAQGPDTVIFVGGALRSSENDDTVRHELTHLVTAQAVKGGFQNLLPLWLNEGISVHAQANPGEYGQSLKQAIGSDSVVPIQTLESSRGLDVGLFYGESYALVRFLIDSGGQSKFAQLLATVKDGKSVDQALQGIYGYDRTGLYNAWRDSVHLAGSQPARRQAAQSTPASSEQQTDTNSTSDNGTEPRRASNSPNHADSGDTVVLLSVGGALVLMLFAAVIAMGLVIARRTPR